MYSYFLLRPWRILLTSAVVYTTKSAVCDQMSSLALWRYASAEAGQISYSAHANAGCFPAPWATFLISTVDPTTASVRQHYTHGPLSLRSSSRPECWLSMTKYPNRAHGMRASSFSIIPTLLIDFASFRLSLKQGTHLAHACSLDATHSAASQTFWYTLRLRTARNRALR